MSKARPGQVKSRMRLPLPVYLVLQIGPACFTGHQVPILACRIFEPGPLFDNSTMRRAPLSYGDRHRARVRRRHFVQGSALCFIVSVEIYRRLHLRS
jgi:hypothetical protein